jgi:hypothetical protein
VIIFTTWSLYPCGKKPRYSLSRELDGRYMRWTGCLGEEKKSGVPTANRTAERVGCILVNIGIERDLIVLYS